AGFEILPAAEAAGGGPTLGLLRGVSDPARAAPGADQNGRPARAARPGRQCSAVDLRAVPHPAHDLQIVFEGAEAMVVIVAEQREIVARRAAADTEDEPAVRHRLQRLDAVGEFDRV